MTAPTPVFPDGTRVQTTNDVELSPSAWISTGQPGTIASHQVANDPPTDPDNPPPSFVLYRVAFDLGVTAEVREAFLEAEDIP